MQRAEQESSEDELARVARLLYATDLLNSTSEDSAYYGQQLVFLTRAGLKPISEFTVGHWVTVPGGRGAAPSDQRQVAALLSEVGVSYSLKADTYGLSVVVARDDATLRKFEAAVDDYDVGRLFGYPETATDAFIRGEVLTAEQQKQAVESAGLVGVVAFCLSAHHWQEELRVVQLWHETIAQYRLVDDVLTAQAA